MASEFEERMVSKYGKKIPEDYVRAIVGLKEKKVDRRFLTPAFESTQNQKQDGFFTKIVTKLGKLLNE